MPDSPATPEVILASASIYRQQLLQQIGLNFRAVSANIDEQVVQADLSLKPEEVAESLAKTKATSVAKLHPGFIVIGSDQVVKFEGETLGKPGSREKNIELLSRLCGKTHRLITAVCVISEQTCCGFTDCTRLTMRPLTRAEIVRYVERDQAFDCAGGYRWESAGITLFEKIETEDHTAILGLPLIRLVTVLRSLGIAIP